MSSITPSGLDEKIVTDRDDSIEQSVSSITPGWLNRVRNGDDSAWTKLEGAYRPLICWWCAKGSVPAQDIDDVAQDVFASLAKALAGYEHESFRGFLWTITRNKICDYWRGVEKHAQCSSLQVSFASVEVESNGSVGAVEQTTKIVFDAIVQLVRSEFSEQDWTAFWRVTVDGETAGEVAERLGITRNMVYLAKTRITRRVREEFGEHALESKNG